MNWNTFDLNLLRVLDAMLQERNTTRVGERVGLSQPAVSSALNRLRQNLRDALFVREGNRMVPTPFAEAIGGTLRPALDRIERSLSGGLSFDPARSTRLFRVMGDDYLAEMVVPDLIAHLSKAAPSVRIQLLPINPSPLAQQLIEGNVDIMFARAHSPLPDWMEHVLVLHGSAIAVASRRNRRIVRLGIPEFGTIPIGLFCEMPQVLFAPDGVLDAIEDRTLAKIGRRRRVVLTVPDFFSVGRMIAQTQLIGLMPDRFALSVADRFGLRIFALPFKMPLVPLHLYWHRRHRDDPEHRWMRELIFEMLEPLDAVRHPLILNHGESITDRPDRSRQRRPARRGDH